MRFSDRDLNVLAHAELQARHSIEVIARQSKLRGHQVRYAVKRLVQTGVLVGPSPIIDLPVLGYAHYTMMFSLTSHTLKDRAGVIRALKKQPLVSWLFSLGGEYHYGVSFSILTTHDLLAVMDGLSREFAPLFFNKQLALERAFTYFGKRYLASVPKNLPRLEFAPTGVVEVLSSRERDFLKVISDSPGISIRELAQKTGESPSTLDRRRRDLEERGIIKGWGYWVNTVPLQRHLFLLLITVRGMSASLRPALHEFIKNQLEVTYLVEYVGAWDFEMGIEVLQPSRVAEITQTLYDQCGAGLEQVRVVPVLEHLTYRRFPQL